MTTFTGALRVEPDRSASLPSLSFMRRPLLTALSIIVCIATLATPVSTYPSGAPSSQCRTMIPGHGSQPSSATPYSINLGAATTYKAGDTLTVTVMGGQFKGLIMQMRQVGTTTVYGKWTNLAMDTRTLTCTNALDTVTHLNNNYKNNAGFTWTAPDNVMVDLEVVATIVQQKSTWWKDVKSATLTYGTPPTPVPATTTVDQGGSTGSTPTVTQAVTVSSTVAAAIQNTSHVLLVTVLTLFAIRLLV